MVAHHNNTQQIDIQLNLFVFYKIHMVSLNEMALKLSSVSYSFGEWWVNSISQADA